MKYTAQIWQKVIFIKAKRYIKHLYIIVLSKLWNYERHGKRKKELWKRNTNEITETETIKT